MTVAPTMTTKSRTSKSQVVSSKKNTQITPVSADR